MDTRDKEFDNWMKSKINAEIPLSKQNRQAAWAEICLTASEPNSATRFMIEDDIAHLFAPVIVREPLPMRLWHWLSYWITQENSYHKAHANSVQHYKASPNYRGGLNLHSLELMRHRWTCAV